MEEMVKVSVMAKLAGVTTRAVQKAIARNEFYHERKGRDFYVHRDALLYFNRNQVGAVGLLSRDDDDWEDAPPAHRPTPTRKKAPSEGGQRLSILEDYNRDDLMDAAILAKALQEVVKAERMQRDNLKEEGLLLPREEYERRLENLATITKTRLLIIPSSTAKEISQMDDPFEIEALLTQKIEDALHELADALEKENA